jgi:hypothetical protein
MTQKTKCPAEAATSKPGDVHLTPPKGKKNMSSNTTEVILAASEHPERRIRNLAKEISSALDEVGDYRVVIIYPSAQADYPVQICLDGEFSELLEAVVKMRKELREAAQ